MSQTYQPKKLKRKKSHGFLSRSAGAGGRAILKRRRAKKRYRISA